MKKQNRFLHLLPVMLLWAVMTAFFWNWIFNLITNVPPSQTISLFADVTEMREVPLAAKLEEDLPDGIRKVKAHPFTYAMVNGGALRAADLFLIPASDAETYRDWFSPLPDKFRDRASLFDADGLPLGILVESSETGNENPYLTFIPPDRNPEAYYLVFGASSLHNPENPDAVDTAALDLAESLLKLLDSEGGTHP